MRKGSDGARSACRSSRASACGDRRIQCHSHRTHRRMCRRRGHAYHHRRQPRTHGNAAGVHKVLVEQLGPPRAALRSAPPTRNSCRLRRRREAAVDGGCGGCGVGNSTTGVGVDRRLWRGLGGNCGGVDDGERGAAVRACGWCVLFTADVVAAAATTTKPAPAHTQLIAPAAAIAAAATTISIAAGTAVVATTTTVAVVPPHAAKRSS